MSSPPRGRHALAFIAITLLLDTIGFGLIIPVMPSLLQTLTGKPASVAVLDAGWLTFVYASMQFLCAPILGALSDRFGRRLPILAGLGIFLIGTVWCAFAGDIANLLVGRTIQAPSWIHAAA